MLIKRSPSRRYLSNHQTLSNLLVDVSSEFGLLYYIYSDNPLPSFEETWSIFRRAVAVVAPHGAGLSNLVFVPPGAAVIEVLKRREVNLCYRTLAYNLGHRYHGMRSETDGAAMVANVSHVEQVLKLF